MQKIRILGIDPGSYNLGVGCIEKTGTQLKMIFCDVLQAPKTMPFFERLKVIQAGMKQVLENTQPHCIAIEDIFYSKSIQSAFQLGTARGMAIGQCLERGLPLFPYAPTQIKKTVTGFGRAEKEQVLKMVQLTLGTRLDCKTFDASDALAIAICHAFAQGSYNFVERLKT